jgi:secreted trypsin-like serine protease
MRKASAVIAVAIVAAAAALAPGSAMARSTATPSVVGGHVASSAEFPSVAYLEYTDASGTYSCTGSVVAPRVVLTAGHCVENIEAETLERPVQYEVATGSADVKHLSPTNVSKVSQVIVNPGFKPAALTGDAGLVILSAPVGVPPIALAGPTDAALLAPNTPFSIAGWGVLNGRTGAESPLLHTAASVVQSAEFCRQQTSAYYHAYNPDLQLCVAESSHKIGGCYGDSGGPGIAHRADGTAVEIGVASSVKPGCITSSPTVYTRVDQLAPWIASWVAAVEKGGPTPPLAIPRGHPPYLETGHAVELAETVLETDFGSRYSHRTYQFECGHLGKSKVQCAVGWNKGGNDYYGKISVFYVISENALLFSDKYRIHSVRLGCLRGSPHPRTCPVRTKHS